MEHLASLSTHKSGLPCVTNCCLLLKKMFHIDCDLYILAQSIGLVLSEKNPINDIFKRNKYNKMSRMTVNFIYGQISPNSGGLSIQIILYYLQF